MQRFSHLGPALEVSKFQLFGDILHDHGDLTSGIEHIYRVSMDDDTVFLKNNRLRPFTSAAKMARVQAAVTAIQLFDDFRAFIGREFIELETT